MGSYGAQTSLFCLGPDPRNPSGPAVIRPHHTGRTYDCNRPEVIAAAHPCETGAVHIWIPAGAAICVWGEFALRMQGGLAYEQLLNLDPSRWRPSQRLIITIGIAFIFAFLLAFDAVQIGVGNLLLNDFAKKTPALALAVGGITGLAFAAVRDVIFRTRPDERR